MNKNKKIAAGTIAAVGVASVILAKLLTKKVAVTSVIFITLIMAGQVAAPNQYKGFFDFWTGAKNVEDVYDQLQPAYVEYWIKWAKVETSPGVYDFESAYWHNAVELIHTRAQAVGAKEIIVFNNCPSFYCPRLCELPGAEDFTAMRAFVRAVLNRVKPWAVIWWNEPDTFSEDVAAATPYWGCSGQTSDCVNAGGELYVPSLKAFYETVQQVEGETNITINVLAGGLSMGGQGYSDSHPSCSYPDLSTVEPGSSKPACSKWAISNYLDGILSAGGGAYFDGIAYHHYDYGTAGTKVPLTCQVSAYDYITSKLAQYNLTNKLLVISETALLNGRSDCDFLVTPTPSGPEMRVTQPGFDQKKAVYLYDLHKWVVGKNGAIDGYIWYTWKDQGWQCADLWSEQNAYPAPAYWQFQNLTDVTQEP
jgi:hypothetical protein